MPPGDIEKLLGGYATNTLTEQERQKLFEAALRDQTLYNALADEHALKEVLDDPRSRGLLIEALTKQLAPLSWWQQRSTWVLAGSMAVALLAVTLVVRLAELPAPPTEATPKLKTPAAPQPVPPTSETANNVPTLSKPELREDTQHQTLDRKYPDSQIVEHPSSETLQQARRSVSPAEPPTQSPPAIAPEESMRIERPAAKPSIPGAFSSTGELRKEADAAPSRPHVRYTLLRRMPDGHYTPADPSTNFQAGDAVRIAIELNADGYLYALSPDETGKLKLIFPPGESGAEHAKAEKNRRYLVPPEDTFTFSAESGDREVVLLFSRTPVAAPEEALEAQVPGKKSSLDTLAGRSGRGPIPTEPAAGHIPQDTSSFTLEIILKHR